MPTDRFVKESANTYCLPRLLLVPKARLTFKHLNTLFAIPPHRSPSQSTSITFSLYLLDKFHTLAHETRAKGHNDARPALSQIVAPACSF